jgi:hypothetical protein
VHTTQRLILLLVVACTVEGAFAAHAHADAPTPPTIPALANFGLNWGATAVPRVGLAGSLTQMAERAAARTCANRCPPPTWSRPDPLQPAIGKLCGVGLGIGVVGVGLALANLGVRLKRETTGKSKPPSIWASLAVRPVAGGIGLSINF